MNHVKWRTYEFSSIYKPSSRLWDEFSPYLMNFSLDRALKLIFLMR